MGGWQTDESSCRENIYCDQYYFRYYGGVTTISREDEMVNGPGGGRRRDNMVRDFVRNGRGWSQPGTGNGTNGNGTVPSL